MPETGLDIFVIDGKYPAMCTVGVEIKDAGWAGGLVPYNTLPKFLKDINTKISSVFMGAGYKCFFANEVRYDGKNGYFTDATCRQPQPNGDLQAELYKNFSEIIWQVANGIVPEIIPAAKFGVQIIIKSDWATNEPNAIYYPAKYANRIKIKNLMYKDDIPYFIPGEVEMCEIGSVCGISDTLEGAIADAKKIAGTVEGDGIKCNGDALDQAAGEIAKLAKYNIKLF